MIQPRIKTLWVAALRSGDYKQTRRFLNKPMEGYCCIGVLCELAVAAKVIPPPALVLEHTAPSGTEVYTYCGTNTGVAPLEVMNWSGLDYEQMNNLIRMNDGQSLGGDFRIVESVPKTFAEIADYIEANL